jgi:predicted DNA binding CopG/RHH family protein
MNKAERLNKIITIRLPSSVLDRINQVAAQEERPKQQMIRLLLMRQLRAMESQTAPASVPMGTA